MKPFVPESNVKKLIVDKNISEPSKRLLLSMGFELLFSLENPKIYDSTSTHPDMQFSPISDKVALVADFAFDYYSNLLPEFTLTAVSDIHSPYPNDSKINVTCLNNKIFLTSFQNSCIKEYISNYQKIFINQGYSKCNICMLNNCSIITSDKGIYMSLLDDSDFEVYLLSFDEIFLKGFDKGFIGGCTGLIDSDKLFFNGDITHLSCYDQLMNILNAKKIEPVYHKEHPLTDIGSIIPVI